MLYEEDSIYDMLVVLNNFTEFKPDDYIPVVKSRENISLLGSVRVVDCFGYLKKVSNKLTLDFVEGGSRYSNSIKYIVGKLNNAVQVRKMEGVNAAYGSLSSEFKNFIDKLEGKKRDISSGEVSF